MEPVQLMNQLLTQLTTKPSTEIHPTPFTGTAADNILDWLENFDHMQHTAFEMIKSSCKLSLST